MRAHNQGGGQVIVQAPHASLVFLTEVNQLTYQDLTKTTMCQSVQPKTLLKIGASFCTMKV